MKVTLTFVFLLSIQSIYGQLVLPGDYPDPSVVKIGESYWATATTSNWAPPFPLLESKDLIHWETKAFVFEQLPEWADYYFWAPEISYEDSRVYIYYSAHKKDGNLCLGIASAYRPEGPYTDHGPLMCEPDGSIDGFPMRDENGKLFLIWKEDGNSIGEPTPIWAMELNEKRTALTGEKKELFRNDASWEKNLVEGVSMIRHGEYFYAFYAGAGCCGRGCTYAAGVARAKNLLGPWEKYENNPVLTNDDQWICPGHGTPVEKDGMFYFLYHAYQKESNVYTGRQGMLKEFRFTSDGWIEFIDNKNEINVRVPDQVSDDFTGNKLSPHWQWSVFQNVHYKSGNGKLELYSLPGKTGAMLGMKTLTADYSAQVVIASGLTDAEGGLAAIGDEKNVVAIALKGNTLILWKLENDQHNHLAETTIKLKGKLYLKMKVSHGKDITFLYSTDGKKFKTLTTSPIDGSFLPPWDRAVRAGLISRGNKNQKTVFEYFQLQNITE